MRFTSYSWLGREFVALRGEGKPGLAPAEATHELLDRMDHALGLVGLSLDNVVRNRFFGRDEQSRVEGSAARRGVLSGRARSAGTSLIALTRRGAVGRMGASSRGKWLHRGQRLRACGRSQGLAIRRSRIRLARR